MDEPASQDSTSSAATTGASTTLRLFWVGMAVFLIIMVVLGFGSTYGWQLVFGKEIAGNGLVETDWAIHLHAAVFVGWMAFLLLQTTLVARGQTRIHMTLGGYAGIGLAAFVIVTGCLMTFLQVQVAVAKDLITWGEWPRYVLATMGQWMSLLLFAILLGLGLLYRSQPATHKRYMVFATVILVGAATSRMHYLFGSAWDKPVGMGLMVAPLFIYDLYTEGRVHPATLVGAGATGVILVVDYL